MNAAENSTCVCVEGSAHKRKDASVDVIKSNGDMVDHKAERTPASQRSGNLEADPQRVPLGHLA